MSETKHTLEIDLDVPITRSTITVTEAQLDGLENQIAEIRKKAEAEKPKMLDFGVCSDDEILMRDGKEWVSLERTIFVRVGLFPKPHILGNLKEIIQQGPIVVGLTETNARFLQNYFGEAVNFGFIADPIRNALARYEKGRP